MDGKGEGIKPWVVLGQGAPVGRSKVKAVLFRIKPQLLIVLDLLT